MSQSSITEPEITESLKKLNIEFSNSQISFQSNYPKNAVQLNLQDILNIEIKNSITPLRYKVLFWIQRITLWDRYSQNSILDSQTEYRYRSCG